MLNIIAGSLSVGVTPSTSSYESIATVTVGSGGTSTITFSSIPSTYTHLQVRFISKMTTTAQLWGRFNSDNGSNYSHHIFYGDGTSPAGAQGTADQNQLYLGYNGWTNDWCAGVIDILDYANTSKYKTTRNSFGTDNNGAGGIMLNSASWRNTNAITRIDFFGNSSQTISEYSQFALYGIKGS